MKRTFPCMAVAMGTLIALAPINGLSAEKRKLVMVAGTPSHPPLMHEFNAGCLLLEKCLQDVPGLEVVVHRNGWPEDPDAFKDADGIFLFMDGGGGHPVLKEDRLAQIGKLMDAGVGLGCAHYAVEVPAGPGDEAFQKWIGGYYENAYSVNPIWTADFKQLPDHPITRGVEPFNVKDEWYFNMRFRDGRRGVQSILSDKPSDDVRDGPYVHPRGPYPHIVAAKGRDEAMMWAVEREDGGRGFGFTGGHFHMNWGDDDFRKVVLNALLWISKVEVPAGGVASSVTEEELMENLDPKRGSRPAVRPSADAGAKPLFRSGLVKSGSVPVDVDLTGAEGLWLVVADAGDGIGCDWADWAEPVLVKQDGSEVKLTDMKWKSATTGHGRVNIDRNCGGGSLKIAGEPVSFGIGTHAPSVIEYDLAGQGFVRFKGRAGVDNGGTNQGCGSTVEFMAFVQPPPRNVAFASAAAAGSGGGRGSGPEAAKEYLKTMTVPEGLEVTLFASEPMLRNPTNMDIDSRGRIWVTEGVNYRSSFQSWGVLREGGDRILILEDTNGDGTADKETVFYQGPEINAALGICVLGNRVIVSRSPNIFVFTDTNGDDRADRKDVWFSGIGGVDHDHGAHAFVFGPDGRLYFNVGNDGGRLKTADGSRYVVDLAGNEVHGHGNPYRQGLVFRCSLQGGELETLAWNFRNNYEVAVDSFGTLWQSDNDDDGNQAVRINYVMEFGNYGFTDEMTGAGWRTKRTNMEETVPQQHWHQNDPGVVPNLLVTGAGSPTGITVYEGRLLPRVFHDQMLHCDAGPRVVRAYPVTPSGAGYEATAVNLLESSDTWFRPSDVSVAPDGSVYVADWNDPGVGGHNMGDRNLETMRGRIYRVAPAGHQSRVGKPDLESAEGAVTALQSPNSATRFLAWTALHRMRDQAETALIRLWNDDNPRMRARALHLLARIPGKERKYIADALKDPDSDIRITGLRIARERRYDMIPYVRMLVDDPSPQVRRECALALRHQSAPEAAGLWASLAVQHDGADRWYLEALGIGADRQWDRYLDEWLKRVGGDWNTPAGRDVVWRSRSKKTPGLLVKIIADGNTSGEERARYIRSLDFIKGPEKDAALIQLLGVN